MIRRSFIRNILGTMLVLSTETKNILAAEIVKLIKKVTTPPGSIDIDNLIDNCIKCNECIDNCPSGVLKPSTIQYGKGNEEIPYLDFSSNFCDYSCNTCSTICPTESIIELPLKKKQITQIGIAEFNKKKCIVVVDKTSCGACAEVCPTSAITLKNIGNNLEIPEINTSLCIGCGACEYACPVKNRDAIYVQGLDTHKEAEALIEEPIKERKKSSNGKTFAF